MSLLVRFVYFFFSLLALVAYAVRRIVRRPPLPPIPGMIEVVEPFMPTTFGGAGSRLDDLFGPPQPLFSREDFPSVLQARADDMLAEIRRYRADELLNTGTERLLSWPKPSGTSRGCGSPT